MAKLFPGIRSPLRRGGTISDAATKAAFVGLEAYLDDLARQLASAEATGGSAGVPTARTLFATAPIRIDGGGSGDLSANRTISYAFSGASAYNSATISLTNITHTLLTFDTELFDTDNYHSTSANTGRMTAPATGYYLIRVGCAFSNNTSGDRQLTLRKNAAGSGSGGTAVARTTSRPFSGGGAQYMELVTVLSMTAGDYVECFAWQNSGVTLTTTAGEEAGTMLMTRLG